MQTIAFLVVFMVLLLAAAYGLAIYMQGVYAGRPGPLGRVIVPLERLVYRVMRIDPEREMRWTEYARGLLLFSVVSVLALFLLQRVQDWLPLNPADQVNVRPDLAFDTAVSFVTNTNWQSYTPEQTMSYLTQMVGLATQNFVSAAVGMAVAVALIRGIVRSGSGTIGNFWADLVRGALYVLLPISLVLAVLLVSQGVVQTFDGPVHAQTVEGATQTIAVGPAASQIAIKQLGTNGGGFYNANSAHPLESGTPFSNFLEHWALLLIPFSMPFLYGRMLGRMRQGLAILAAMLVLLGVGAAVAVTAETRTTPALTAAGLNDAPNLEGKEQRITVQESALWAVSTTGTSTGAVNSMHDSYTAVGGMTAMVMMLLGEVAPGGVGTGLYGILLFAVVTVFIAGLMVGRTPEFLGKRIGAREVKLALLGTLIMPVGFLVSVGIASILDQGLAGPLNAGPHGFSEILYGYASAWNNNGSAFAGLTAGTDFYDGTLGVAMAIGRFAVIVPALALAGTLAAQRTRPIDQASMPTQSPIFVGLLVGVILIIGALSFFPALALGPVAEALTSRLW
jgi:potassium-transporting ATPase potassium-binding subunit